MIKAVLWDLDGTVLASKEGVFNSIAYALNKLSLPLPDAAELMAFLGPPIDYGFAQVCRVPEAQVADAIRFYREYYNGGGKFEAHLFDGVADTVLALRKKGLSHYITTSKPQVFARQILAHFQADSLFDGIYGSELDGSRAHKADVLRYCMAQHDLTTEDVILVGDRLYDVKGAAQCGIPCIGILFGYGTRKELEDAGAAYIVADTDELFTQLSLL